MAFRCPHCGEKGVGSFAKLFSLPHAPAKCRICSGLSAESPRFALIFGAGVYVGFLVACAHAFRVAQWWPFGVFLGAFVLLTAIQSLVVPLMPIDKDVARREYRFRVSMIVFIIATILIVGMFAEWSNR